jgi:1-deoxy-D-xylulose-5-phosphate reductoisomerase
MGKKISIDSATMMNKVFEVIEAQRIFEIDINKFKILTHPNSYVHAIVKFNNGLIKIIAHDTTMNIPIFNTLYLNSKKTLKSKNLDIHKLNNLNFKKIEHKRYPVVKFLENLPEKNSLYETVIVAANDKLVDMFLKNKIKFLDISRILLNLSIESPIPP